MVVNMGSVTNLRDLTIGSSAVSCGRFPHDIGAANLAGTLPFILAERIGIVSQRATRRRRGLAASRLRRSPTFGDCGDE